MDPKQAVAVITEYVGSRNLDVPDNVRDAAGVYAQCCLTINERLVACDELLKVNQRSEAVRQVQLEPDLLQLFAACDLRDRDRWADIATQVALPVPPRLNAAAARRLHAAFTAEQAVTALLVQYRLLALSRAPLKRRLDVIRLLAKSESTNLGWAADVRTYEAARFEEMRATLHDPEQADDWNVVNALNDELGGRWSNPPPLDLVGAVQKQHTALRRAKGAELLDELNPRLLRAMADGDLDGAEELEAQARATAEKYDLTRNTRLLAPLRQAGEWIDRERGDRKRERQFETAVRALRLALTENIDADYIRSCYRVVLEYDEFVLPEDVATAYASWQRGRRLMLWGAVVAAVLALLTGVALYLIFVRK